MASIPARFGRFACASCAALGLAFGGGVALTARPAISSTAAASPTHSLCRADEEVIATCILGSKIASVCGQTSGRATYRFGQRNRVELQSSHLHFASQMFSGGGETQIYLARGAYRYVLFDRTIRTGFGRDGNNNPEFSSGLLVQRSGKAVRSSQCSGANQSIASVNLSRYMAEGAYVEH
jgi:hypothetical protein